MNKGKAPFKMESESPEGFHVLHMYHTCTTGTTCGSILYIPQQEESYFIYPSRKKEDFSRRLATTQPMRNCCNSTNEKPPQPRILALLQ